MARFDLHDMKKQASLFFREKFKDARLALTDVSRIQLLTEEATNADPWGPETRTMALLSDAAFELQEYERIVQVLHSRLDSAEKKPWRQIYKTLVVLEYLLTHGPASLTKEFRNSALLFEDLCHFSFIDQQGIDRGLSVRKKADKVLELLNMTEAWKEERSRAQKISYGIHGFGSSQERKSLGVEDGEVMVEVAKSEGFKGAEDPENLSLLSEEQDTENSSGAAEAIDKGGEEWQPFGKCQSIPVYLRHGRDSDGSKPESEEFAAAWSPYKKTLSSPGFRDTSIRQPSADNMKHSDQQVMGSDGDSTMYVDPTSTVDACRSFAMEARASSHGVPTLPVLPPPPRPKFRTKFHRPWKPASLIDL